MKKNEKGQVLIFTMFALVAVLFSVLFIIGGSQIYYSSSSYSSDSEKALALAEAGLDKAISSLNTMGNSYNGETGITFGDGAYTTTVTTMSNSNKLITATGYLPSASNPRIKKTVKIQASNGTGISFTYGMLIGNGGISIGNDSSINGSIYSNGNISGGNNETITGDVYVAGGTQASADQQNDCTGLNCADFIFGKNVAGNDQLDIAQSFKPSITHVINKVSLKLKKFGSPPNLTIRILADSSGNPDKNNVLASGILSANLVTGQYDFIDVTLSSSPTLTEDTLYWILIDTSSDSSNYWAWSNDIGSGYTRGSPKWSTDWSAAHPVWNNISGDLGFKTWMGGVTTSITMSNGSVVSGNVHANTISGITINKDAYYQTISNSIVKGVSYPNSIDPVPVAMPISDANISQWKDGAVSYGTSSGNITGCPSALGPGKISGNVSVNNNCTVTVKSPVWITGNFTVGNSDIFKMDSSLGSVSGVIIVDGTSVLSNGDDLLGTGATGSYLTLLSTYDSVAHEGTVAINTNNSSITGILYAPYGILTLANSAHFKEAIAWQINMGTGTTLTYDSGLISTFFSAGPTGSLNVIKGTYQTQ